MILLFDDITSSNERKLYHFQDSEDNREHLLSNEQRILREETIDYLLSQNPPLSYMTMWIVEPAVILYS